MFVSVQIRMTMRANGRPINRRVLILQCDECGVEFERSYQKRVEEQDHHFCNRVCRIASQRKGSLLDEARKAKIQNEHGVDYFFQSDVFIEKSRCTCRRRYGVDHHSQTVENRRRFREKFQLAFEKKYGAKHVMDVPELKMRALDSRMLHRYGLRYDEWIALTPHKDQYYHRVRALTEKNSTSIEGIEKRGQTDHHLDHKFSISEGFRLGITPSALALCENLQMLPYDENIRKSEKCTLSLESLYYAWAYPVHTFADEEDE